MIDIIVTGIVTPSLLLVVQYFIARRKERAEIKTTEANAKTIELDSVQEAIKIWRETAEALVQDVKEREAELKKRDEINEELRESMRQIHDQYSNLEDHHKVLMENHKVVLAKLETIELDYAELLKKYESLKGK